MKNSLRLALAALVLLGCVCTSFATVPPYSFSVPSSPSSEQMTDSIYNASGCAGIAAHFNQNPPPVGAIDLDTGREIIGWEVECPDTILASGGQTGGDPSDERVIPRAWGNIIVHYAPLPR